LSIHEIINDCAEKFRLKIAKKHGEINLLLDSVENVVSGDSILITTVFNNLIDNAIKYSKDIPQISISTKKADQNLIIYINDKGLGMNKDTLKKIFDKFFRVNTGNVHNVKGFGLGLSYVKAILLAHNGTIDVESEPNKGSTFIVTLPITNKQ
jgi:two-component system phosphate regulon sensor histidine kinase PhoR